MRSTALKAQAPREVDVTVAAARAHASVPASAPTMSARAAAAANATGPSRQTEGGVTGPKLGPPEAGRTAREDHAARAAQASAPGSGASRLAPSRQRRPPSAAALLGVAAGPSRRWPRSRSASTQQGKEQIGVRPPHALWFQPPGPAAVHAVHEKSPRTTRGPENAPSEFSRALSTLDF